MKVTQIYNIMNTVTKEVLGETAVVNEDLSNIVDIGTEIFNANAVDNYVKKLVDHIGKVIFVDRVYSGSVPSVLMDSWEYGSVIEKITVEMPEATENEDWELTDGSSYDPNVFHAPKVSAKFFNSKVTFEIDMSFTEKQLKSSFSNVGQLNSFLTMIYNSIDKSLTVKIDSLVMRVINSMIAGTINADYDVAETNSKSGVKAVNLLFLYNEKFKPEPLLTADKCLTDSGFLRFAALTMSNYIDRMGKLSTLFNVGKRDRFTPRDLLHVVTLSDFNNAASVYLQSDTYHKEMVSLPQSETVPYWQGCGTDYSFNNISDIDVKVKNAKGETKVVHQSGILGVMFDRDALGVSNLDRRVTSHYNAKAEFYNNFYKFDAGYYADYNENFVVFFVA